MKKYLLLVLSLYLLSSFPSYGMMADNDRVIYGGGHPKTVSAKYDTKSPDINFNIYKGQTGIGKESVEHKVYILFTGSYRPSKNYFRATAIPSKYEGDSGIDNLFYVESKDGWFYLAVESKYRADGKPQFDQGIRMADGKYAGQMLTEWLRQVAYNLKTLKNDYESHYKFIFNNPGKVVRALAVGDKNGIFQIYALKDYSSWKRDTDILQAMFKK